MKKLIFFLIFLVVFSGIVFSENNTTIKAIEGGDSNISFEDGYKGYCAEWGEHSAEEGQVFGVEDSSRIDNSNYLKTMFLFFYNQTQKDVYATQHMVWKFTDDKQFSRFNQSWYNQIVEIGDKYTVPDAGKIVLNDTHQFSFDFRAFVPFFDDFQTFFGYRFMVEEIPDNSTIEINNTTTNNSTIIMPEYGNNSTISQNNETSLFNEIFNIQTSTLNQVNMEKTGNKYYMLICIIIIICFILILNRKK